MAKRTHHCGIYAIEQIGTERFYVGSSADIGGRWTTHRRLLESGKHTNPQLRHAWAKYGATAFRLIILEECERVNLLEREQAYIDGLRPWFNVAPRAGSPPPPSPEVIARLRARAAAITHCPKGHPYDKSNTYRNNEGYRRCRLCRTLQMSGVYAKETPEQREARLQRMDGYYEANKPRIAAQMHEYGAARKEEKRAYDVARKAIANEQRRTRHAAETPEQRETRLAYRREHERDTWAESNRRRREKLKATP